MTDETEFRLGDWTVWPERSTIERDDKEIHIKPKSMAVLERLADARGKVVSREALFTDVWPGAVVSDDTLTQCVVELRKAFGDSVHEAKYIETIPKKGFRLVPPVRPISGETNVPFAKGSPPGQERQKLATLVLQLLGAVLVVILFYWFRAGTDPVRNRTLTIEDTPTLAVLPFVDASPTGEQEHLADGLSEELLNRLGRLDDLLVAGRTSSFYFKGKDTNLEEIRETLNVGHVLEGSVRISGDMLRITAQLVDTSNGFQLWSETYDRLQEDIFTIQVEIAEAVAAALSITLGVGELGKMVGGTSNVEAYNEVLLGNAQYRIYSPESVYAAVDHFRRAVELDPDYAIAWERLANVYITARFITEGELSRNWVELSGNTIDRALSLAPESIPINQTAAFRLTHLRQWREAELAFARIDDMNGIEDINKSTFLMNVGRAPDALEIMERERRLDPLWGIIAYYLADIYQQTGRLDDAVAEVERAFMLGTYRDLVIFAGVIIALTVDDRKLIVKWLNRQSEHIPTLREINATLIGMLDDPEASLSYLVSIYELPQMNYPWLAMWASYHSDYELALRAVNRAGGYDDWNPLHAGMRKLSGYKDIIRETGLVEYWREFGWGYYCKPVGEDDFECE